MSDWPTSTGRAIRAWASSRVSTTICANKAGSNVWPAAGGTASRMACGRPGRRGVEAERCAGDLLGGGYHLVEAVDDGGSDRRPRRTRIQTRRGVDRDEGTGIGGVGLPRIVPAVDMGHERAGGRQLVAVETGEVGANGCRDAEPLLVEPRSVLHRGDSRERSGERHLPGAADEGAGSDGQGCKVESCRRRRCRQPGPHDVECLSGASLGVDALGRHDAPATAGAQQVRQHGRRRRLERTGERIGQRLPDLPDGLVAGENLGRWRFVGEHGRAVLGHGAQGRRASSDHRGQGGGRSIGLSVFASDRGVACYIHLLASEAFDDGQVEGEGVDRLETEVGERHGDGAAGSLNLEIPRRRRVGSRHQLRHRRVEHGGGRPCSQRCSSRRRRGGDERDRHHHRRRHRPTVAHRAQQIQLRWPRQTRCGLHGRPRQFGATSSQVVNRICDEQIAIGVEGVAQLLHGGELGGDNAQGKLGAASTARPSHTRRPACSERTGNSRRRASTPVGFPTMCSSMRPTTSAKCSPARTAAAMRSARRASRDVIARSQRGDGSDSARSRSTAATVADPAEGVYVTPAALGPGVPGRGASTQP